VNMSMASIMEKTGHQAGESHGKDWTSCGERGQGAMEKQTKKGEENSQIGILRRITPSKQILYVYIMQH
jgi:hypothetical protein